MGTNDQQAAPQVAPTAIASISPIQSEIDAFAKGVDSLIATFPLTMWFVQSARGGAREELRGFITTKCTNVRTSGSTITGDLPAALQREYSLVKRKAEHTEIAVRAISRSFIVSLIIQYDSFIGGLVRTLICMRPELINASERTVTFKELNTFSSIGDARDFIVEKEVETLIRKSHAEQFDWLENKFSVKLRKGLESWKAFIEVTERRNLFVHCEGRVSSQYLGVCKEHDIDCTGHSLGQELTVSQTYFAEASECVVEIGLKLGHVLWRKLAPDQREAADGNLNQICLDLIADRRYRLAIKLLDFATNTLKNWSSEAIRRIFILNRAQAYKWSNDEKTCEKILAAEDWTAVEDKLNLAVAVLRNDYAAAISYMKRIGNDGRQVPMEAYSDWPIFREFRKTDVFKKLYKDVFNQEFSGLHDAPQISYTFKWDVSVNPQSAKTPAKETSKPN